MDLSHPAHFHLLRNTIAECSKNGHKIFITVKNDASIIKLLDYYQFKYTLLQKKSDSLLAKALKQAVYNYHLWKFVTQNNIELGFCSSFTMTQIAPFTKMHAILLDDDDDDVEPLVALLGHPFAKAVLSPDCVKRKTKNLISYNGYHELAYLHPSRFTPDQSILYETGIKANEVFFVLRFNAFKAHHDQGVKGISLDDRRKLVSILEKKGRVLISAEREIEPEFQKYSINIPNEKIHSLLYYAQMFVGDSQTMTSEAAVLGTPAIRCNSFVGKISYLEEQEHKYQLTYGFRPDETSKMFNKIESLLSLPDLKQIWAERRKLMLKDKIDVTKFFVKFIQDYPRSLINYADYFQK